MATCPDLSKFGRETAAVMLKDAATKQYGGNFAEALMVRIATNLESVCQHTCCTGSSN
jgi:hypothetical protein